MTELLSKEQVIERMQEIKALTASVFKEAIVSARNLGLPTQFVVEGLERIADDMIQGQEDACVEFLIDSMKRYKEKHSDKDSKDT